MKKISLFAALLLASSMAFAGGHLTNTNQSVAFVRNPARLATMELDGAYSNPAGLAWIGEGWHLSFGWQTIKQERDIKSTFAGFAGNVNNPGQTTRTFNGDVFAPIFPTLDAAYQKGNWTFSSHIGVVGGGGKAEFDNGLPMFEAPISIIAPTFNRASALVQSINPAMANQLASAQGYNSSMALCGEKYIYGIQLGATYKIFDNVGSLKQGLSVHLGARASIMTTHYTGHLRNVQVGMGGQMVSPTQTLQTLATMSPDVAPLYMLSNGIELDCEQSDWGIAPIIGVDYRIGNFNFGARYEFKTNLNLESDTKVATPEALLAGYGFTDGATTPSDIPAILAVGAQWSVLPQWRVMAGWNMYFDKDADMQKDKQKFLDHNTYEFTAGTEYDINKTFTVSAGYQRTNYGLTDEYQTDLDFNSDSFVLAIGLRANINKHISIDAGYFRSFYEDYTKNHENYNSTSMPGTDVYQRENSTFGVGVTWHL